MHRNCYCLLATDLCVRAVRSPSWNECLLLIDARARADSSEPQISLHKPSYNKEYNAADAKVKAWSEGRWSSVSHGRNLTHHLGGHPPQQ